MEVASGMTSSRVMGGRAVVHDFRKNWMISSE